MNENLILPKGFPVTLDFYVENVTADATPTDGVRSGGAGGFRVPTGYAFHAVGIAAYVNAAITVGSIAVKVTDDGTELTNTPVATLTDAAQYAEDLERAGAEPVPAASVVGVSATGTANLDAATKDVTVTLLGFLLPV